MRLAAISERGPEVAPRGLVVNAVVVGIWVWSRTVGLPIGPKPGTPEQIGAADSISTGLEAVIDVWTTLLLAPIFRWREPSRPVVPRFPVFAPVDGTSCGVKSLVRIRVRTIDDIDGARCRTTAPINRIPASPLRRTARARSRSPGTSAPSLAAPRFAFAPSPSPRGRCPPSSASSLPAAASASVPRAPPAPRRACHRRPRPAHRVARASASP